MRSFNVRIDFAMLLSIFTVMSARDVEPSEEIRILSRIYRRRNLKKSNFVSVRVTYVYHTEKVGPNFIIVEHLTRWKEGRNGGLKEVEVCCLES